jgi:hypothetical protein
MHPHPAGNHAFSCQVRCVSAANERRNARRSLGKRRRRKRFSQLKVSSNKLRKTLTSASSDSKSIRTHESSGILFVTDTVVMR